MNELTNSVPVETLDIPGLNLLPEKYRMWVLLVIALSPYITRAFHSLAKGGGFRGMFSAIWLGTNTPNPGSANPATSTEVKPPGITTKDE